MRRIVATLIAVAALVGAQVATDQPGDEACFRDKINFERAAVGVPTLKRNTQIETIARRHSQQMAARETIYHNDQIPEDLASAGLKMEVAGENVGMGSSCDVLHDAFMASPGHRANILDPDYRQFGVGVVKRDTRLYVTELFFTPAGGKPAPKPPSKPAPKPAPAGTCPKG